MPNLMNCSHASFLVIGIVGYISNFDITRLYEPGIFDTLTTFAVGVVRAITGRSVQF